MLTGTRQIFGNYLRGFVGTLKPIYIFTGESWTLDMEEGIIWGAMMLHLKFDSTNLY